LGVGVGLVLEEVQMMPGALTGVVDRLVLRITVRTGKPRSTRERHLEADVPSFRFETDSVIESPGLPGCVATQPTFYQLNNTTTRLASSSNNPIPQARLPGLFSTPRDGR